MTEDKSDGRLQISDSRCVMFSINKPHTDNIKSGFKKSELRLKAPTVYGKYRAFIYETKKNGGCGKVIGEFIARNVTGYGHLDVGVPMDLLHRACISNGELMKYTAGGKKTVTEIRIYNLLIYDKPKELGEFYRYGSLSYDDWLYGIYNGKGGSRSSYESYKNVFKLIYPPQSWCYVEEL